MLDTPLRHALAYARLGMRIHPLHNLDAQGNCTCRSGAQCPTPGKHPRLSGWPNQATINESILAGWWQQWPQANVGLLTGEGSGVIALDIDPRHGGEESLAALEKQYGPLPETAEVLTGGGGRHIYFRHPGIGIVKSCTGEDGIAPGIELKADGGQNLVMPPSFAHKGGNVYTWEAAHHISDTPLAAIPEWLLTLGIKGRQSAPAARLPEEIRDGQRNGLLTSLAGSMRRRGASEHAIYEALRTENTERCNPPLDDDEVQAIAKSIARYEPVAATVTIAAGVDGNGEIIEKVKPRINAHTGSLPEATRLAWEALTMANDPIRILRYSGMAIRIESNDAGLPCIMPLTQDRLRYELGEAAEWYKPKGTSKGGEIVEIDARPPLDVVCNILATPDLPLPVLRGIVEAPLFAPDGTIQITPGYNVNGGMYYAPRDGLALLPISKTPSDEEITKAKGLIDEILIDFPFVEPADRTNAIGLLLLPFAREFIKGPTPNHLIEAPVAGNGKGLLNDCLLYPAVGHDIAVMPAASDNAEWEKQITAALLKAPQAVAIDNVSDPIKSGNLAMAYTARYWGARILGRSENCNIPIRCVWTMTANNPTMSDEIMRRSVRIRIDAKQERPWDRQNFRHDNLRHWVETHRADLIWAALTLIQHWLAKGRLKPNVKALGSYEEWTDVIGGILASAGYDSFLANLPVFYEAADIEGQAWHNFVEVWENEHHQTEVGTTDLFPLALKIDGFDFGKGRDQAQKTSFGMQLAKKRDCVIGDYRITKAKASSRASKWRLVPTVDLLTSAPYEPYEPYEPFSLPIVTKSEEENHNQVGGEGSIRFKGYTDKDEEEPDF